VSDVKTVAVFGESVSASVSAPWNASFRGRLHYLYRRAEQYHLNDRNRLMTSSHRPRHYATRPSTNYLKTEGIFDLGIRILVHSRDAPIV